MTAAADEGALAFVRIDAAVPPNELHYGYYDTTFCGRALLATLQEAVCYIALYDKNKTGDVDELAKLQRDFPASRLIHQQDAITYYFDLVFGKKKTSNNPVKVALKGTDLQCDVWKTLCDIPFGKTMTYTQLAAAVYRPKAVRAVASAVARNRIAYLIPCHRVVAKSPSAAGVKYKWGSGRKLRILDYEQCCNNK